MLVLPSPQSRTQQHTDAGSEVRSTIFNMGVDVMTPAFNLEPLLYFKSSSGSEMGPG